MNTDKIARYVWIGRKDINWYQDCEDVFKLLFSADKLETVAKIFAATSINTSLKSNITLFRKALHELENGKQFGKYLPNIKLQLERIRRGEDLSGRKINSFARAMSGDKNAVVVDIWLLRAFDMDRKYFRKDPGTDGGLIVSPVAGIWEHTVPLPTPSKKKKRGRERSGGASDKQYSLIEDYVRREAYEMNLEPRQLCAMIWAGVRTHTNGPAETHYKNILQFTLQNLFS